MKPKTTPLIFTHIPKAAGNTINIIIQRNYLFSKGYFFNSPNVRMMEQFKNLPEHVRRKMAVIKGHLYYGVHKYCPVPVHYFTSLREPLSRAVSEYNYIFTIPHHPNYKELHENQYTLKQLLENGLIKNMDNCQVRFLCGVDDIPFGAVNEEHLQMAIDNLEKRYEQVGIMEAFDESILLFARKFNWATPYYTWQNVNHKKRVRLDELDSETLEMLHRFNRYDMVLYEKGKQILQKQIEAAGPGFYDEVAKFRKRNAQLKPFIKARTFFVRYATQAKYYMGLQKGS